MRKLLLGTTALIASAGIASAEITVSGSAEMGIVGGENIDTQFHNDFTIKFVGSGETDGGLTFGLLIELEESNGGDEINGAASYDNEAVFISGAYGTLTLGEIDGAYDKRLSEVALAGGSIADDETVHAGYNGNSGLDGSFDNQVLRYDYEFGDFGFSVSMEQFNDGGAAMTVPGAGTDYFYAPILGLIDTVDVDDIYGIGISYDTEFSGVGMSFGLGYQTGGWYGIAPNIIGPGIIAENFLLEGEADIVGASMVADFGNGFSAALNYSIGDISASTTSGNTHYDGEVEHVGVGLAYEMDVWTIAANWGQYDYSWDARTNLFGLPFLDFEGSDSYTEEGYGLIVNYDLGGGAVIQAGYGGGDSDETYSLGVAMSF